jgi:hypothetical protein
MAGVEWTLSLPAPITAGAPALGAAAIAAGKAVTCGTSTQALTTTCILIGDGSTLNNTPIGSGVIATIPITVPASTAPGVYGASLTSLLGASTAVPTTSITIPKASGNITVVASIYDLNGDGVVNAADVQLMLSQNLAGTCVAPASGVGDGKCGLVDVQLEILAALGLVH